MAKTTLEVKVSIEKTLHQAIASVLQEIFHEHGVAITNISVDWLVQPLARGAHRTIGEVEITTTSRPASEQDGKI